MKTNTKQKMTIQNKLIICLLILSTILIVSIAYWTITQVKSGLDKSYDNFGQLLVKTLATQNSHIIDEQNL
ncbi:hypothetical protein IJ670_02545 [bacterium]|nr:hypothetical protein [bacterium]